MLAARKAEMLPSRWSGARRGSHARSWWVLVVRPRNTSGMALVTTRELVSYEMNGRVANGGVLDPWSERSQGREARWRASRVV
jgi:hypothetical protein